MIRSINHQTWNLKGILPVGFLRATLTKYSRFTVTQPPTVGHQEENNCETTHDLDRLFWTYLSTTRAKKVTDTQPWRWSWEYRGKKAPSVLSGKEYCLSFWRGCTEESWLPPKTLPSSSSLPIKDALPPLFRSHYGVVGVCLFVK
jgi:hypothetical protein